MRTKMLTEILERVDAWPARAQDRLAEIVLDIEAEFSGDEYQPSRQELAGIKRGLLAAEEGRFATDEAVEAVLRKLRNG